MTFLRDEMNPQEEAYQRGFEAGRRVTDAQHAAPQVTGEMVERAVAHLAARMLYPPTEGHLRGALAAAFQETRQEDA